MDNQNEVIVDEDIGNGGRNKLTFLEKDNSTKSNAILIKVTDVYFN